MKNVILSLVFVFTASSFVCAAETKKELNGPDIEAKIVSFFKTVKHRLHIALHGCPAEKKATVKK